MLKHCSMVEPDSDLKTKMSGKHFIYLFLARYIGKTSFFTYVYFGFKTKMSRKTTCKLSHLTTELTDKVQL